MARERDEQDEAIVTGMTPSSADNLPSADVFNDALAVLGETGSKPRRMWSNLEPTTVDQAASMMRAMRNADYNADTLPNGEMSVTHLMVHEVDIVDEESGEIHRLPRTVIMDKEGKSCAFVSMGIADSVRFIVRLFGNGPWNPGIPVKLVQARTRKKFRMYFLELVSGKKAPKLLGQ